MTGQHTLESQKLEGQSNDTWGELTRETYDERCRLHG